MIFSMTTKAVYIRRRIALLIIFVLMVWGVVYGRVGLSSVGLRCSPFAVGVGYRIESEVKCAGCRVCLRIVGRDELALAPRENRALGHSPQSGNRGWEAFPARSKRLTVCGGR